jgi:RNA polymerase sigma factor (sigma-70 family)
MCSKGGRTLSIESPEVNPQAWVQSYIEGDAGAGERLAEHVIATLQRKMRRFGVPPQEAEDLAQNCALEILRRINEYDEAKGQLDAWVGGFALNAVRMHRRSLIGRRAKDLPIEELPNLAYEVGAASTRKDNLLQALESLDVMDRELLHLRYSLRLSSADIAASSDMNAAQVRKRISRAVEKLRQHPAIRQLLTQ